MKSFWQDSTRSEVLTRLARLTPEHPAFGTMTARRWGAIGYRHTDHHLRQFGV